MDGKGDCVHYPPKSSGQSDFADFLMSFGNSAAICTQDVTEFESVARYRVRVFLAMCEVALFAKQPPAIIEQAQREFHKVLNVKSKVSTQSLTRNRRAVRWLVGRSDALCAKFGGKHSAAG